MLGMLPWTQYPRGIHPGHRFDWKRETELGTKDFSEDVGGRGEVVPKQKQPEKIQGNKVAFHGYQRKKVLFIFFLTFVRVIFWKWHWEAMEVLYTPFALDSWIEKLKQPLLLKVFWGQDGILVKQRVKWSIW